MSKNKIYLIFALFFLILAGFSIKKIVVFFIKPNKVYLSVKNIDTAQKILVSEKGILEFPDSSKKVIKNHYVASLMFKEKDGKLNISGTYTGKIDKKLQSIVKSHDIDFSLNFDNKVSFCPNNFSPLYPVSVKRLLYFFPKKHLFEGKLWKGYFCNGKLTCSYKIFKITKKDVKMGFRCSGSINNNRLVIFSTAKFDLYRRLFKKFNLNLMTFSKKIATTWIFDEKSF